MARGAEDLLGAALSHRELAQSRPVGTAKVDVFNPSVEEHGWASGHTVVQIVTDDMPFLVDSVTAELLRMDRTVHLVVHPTMRVRRDATGELEELLLDDAPGDGGFGEVRESWMHLEIDRESHQHARDEVAEGLRRVLGNVRESVEDWPKMQATLPPARRRAGRAAAARHTAVRGRAGSGTAGVAGRQPLHLPRLPRVRCCTAVPTPTAWRRVHGTGLGLLRYDPTGEGVQLSEQARSVARAPELLIITKANARATVHRNTYLDYVSVKQFDDVGAGDRREALPRALHVQRLHRVGDAGPDRA